MKFIGHTMATPGMDVSCSIDLFADLGLDGIEIVIQAGTAFSIETPDEKVQSIIKHAKERNLRIVTLTPYFWDINSSSPDIARDNVEGLKKSILLAEKMGAKFVRAYGGRDKSDDEYDVRWSKAVAALREAGEYALERNVTICIENHPGTLTVTGASTRKIVDEVKLPNVAALYDPANVMYHSDEEWEYTMDVQEGTIGYVHVKDYYVKDGKRFACNVGEGIVPWDKIMKKLKNRDCYLSFEYEKRWYPEILTDAEIGVGKSLEYIKSIL